MGHQPVDRNKKYMEETWGTTRLVTDYGDLPKKQVIQEVMHDDLNKEYEIPEDRMSRPCGCLLYTSPSPRDLSTSRMPSSA